jgi:hypothetical protein
MPHGGAAPGFEVLTHPDQYLVRRRTHERDQLRAVLQIDRAQTVVSLGVGRAVSVEIGSAGPPSIAAVLTDADLGIGRIVCTGHGTELAADWQLPADVWLGFQEVSALAQGQQVQGATLTSGKAGAIEKDARAIDDPRFPARQFAFGDMIRMLLLNPAADACVLLVLPLAGLQLLDRFADPLLIRGVCEMSTQGAAAVMRPVGVDPSAAAAIDARPPRGQPGEVAAEDLAVIGWIFELHKRPRKADQHFWHARQCMPAVSGRERR